MLIPKDILDSINFKTLGDKYAKWPEVKMMLLITDECAAVPEEWKNVSIVDATNGLTPEIVDEIMTEIAPVMEQAKTEAEEIEEENDGQYEFERELDTVGIEKLAEVDDSAPNTLKRAVHYIVGDTVPQDYERAFKLVKKALEENSDDVQTNFIAGLCYEFNIDDSLDEADAPDYYSVAMKGGHPLAAERYAIANIKVNEYEKAKNAITDKAKEGDVNALFIMGVICEADGNFEDAVEYYSEAAEVGDARSQNSLGCMYVEGNGVGQNLETALNWLELAADQGLGAAHLNIALIQLQDCSDSDSLKEAMGHLEKAAEAGFYQAESILNEIKTEAQIRENNEAQRIAAEQRKREAAARRAEGFNEFMAGLDPKGLLSEALNIFR